MSSERSRAIRVGALAAASVVVLAAFVLSLSSNLGPFTRRIHYTARFPSIQGLSEGAEVRFMGVTVGEVSAVELAPDPASSDVLVRLSVKRSVARRIDGLVVAELRTNGPLGDRLVELKRVPGSPGTPLRDGAEIPAKASIDIVGMGSDLFQDVQSIAGSLDTITARLVAGDGVVGRLLKDKEYGDRLLTDLEVTVAQVREIVDKTNDGRNLLGTVLSDEPLARQVTEQLKRSVSSLEDITGRVQRGEGALGQLTRDDSELSVAMRDLAAASRNFREVSERLASSKGLLYRLTADPEYGDRVAKDIAESLDHVRSITAKIDVGKGSAGMLLNDPQIYSSVNDITRGIERSWFVRFILKRKQKKGFEARIDRILRESPDPDADLLSLMKEILEEEESAAPGAPAREAPAREAPASRRRPRTLPSSTRSMPGSAAPQAAGRDAVPVRATSPVSPDAVVITPPPVAATPEASAPEAPGGSVAPDPSAVPSEPRSSRQRRRRLPR